MTAPNQLPPELLDAAADIGATVEMHVTQDDSDPTPQWERDALARAIYAGAVARVAPALGSDGMGADRAFLGALASMSRFAAAVYFEADDDDENEAAS